MPSIRRVRCVDFLLRILLIAAGFLQACTATPPARSEGGEAGDDGISPSGSQINRTEENGDLHGSPLASSPEGGTPFTGLLRAKDVLTVALAEADQTKRLVFLHSGASW